MDIVQFAIYNEKGGDKLWEVNLINHETLVGKLTAFNGGIYALDNGRENYFTADKVVSIALR